MGRLEALLAFQSGREATLQHSTNDERAFYRIRRLACREELLDLAHQACRVSHVRRRRKEELRRLDTRNRLDLGREVEILDRAVEHQQRRAEPVVMLDEVSRRLLDQ